MLAAASRDGLVSAAHDLSEGGLVQAVVEAALAGETGCRIVHSRGLESGTDPFTFLFSESAGRVLVAVPRTEESRFRAMCEARGLPATRIGVVDQGSDAQSRCRACSPFPWRTCAARRRACFPGCSGDCRSPANDTRYSSGRGAWSASTSSAWRSARCSSACR